MSILVNPVDNVHASKNESTYSMVLERGVSAKPFLPITGASSILGTSLILSFPDATQPQIRVGLPEIFNFHKSNPSETVSVNDNPMIGILANFNAIPDEYRGDMFTDFRTVAESEDFRGLLDTISDWAATAELHANPSLTKEVQEAIGGRQEVADWLLG